MLTTQSIVFNATDCITRAVAENDRLLLVPTGSLLGYFTSSNAIVDNDPVELKFEDDTGIITASLYTQTYKCYILRPTEVTSSRTPYFLVQVPTGSYTASLNAKDLFVDNVSGSLYNQEPPVVFVTASVITVTAESTLSESFYLPDGTPIANTAYAITPLYAPIKIHSGSIVPEQPFSGSTDENGALYYDQFLCGFYNVSFRYKNIDLDFYIPDSQSNYNIRDNLVRIGGVNVNNTSSIFFFTASWTNNAITASVATSASYSPFIATISASWASQSLSASWAPDTTVTVASSSWASQSLSASFLTKNRTYEVTASWAVTSSFAKNASNADNSNTASWSSYASSTNFSNLAAYATAALSASWASSSISTSYITASNIVGKIATSVTADTASYITSSNVIGTIITAATASYVTSSNVIGTVTSASFAPTRTDLYKNNGNAFGASANIGASDNNEFVLMTNFKRRLSINASGEVGVGAQVPSYPFHAQFTGSATAGTPFRVEYRPVADMARIVSGYFETQMLHTAITTGSSGYNAVLEIRGYSDANCSRSIANSIYGVYTNIENRGTASCAAATGYYVNISNFGDNPGVITNSYCFSAAAGPGNGIGQYTNVYGYFASAMKGVTNTYGVYISAIAGGTNRYAFYSAGASDQVYIAGPLTASSISCANITGSLFGTASCAKNATTASYVIGLVPVGSIIAWAKSFINTPALPSEFVECNGQSITDPGGPYDSHNAPILNGQDEGFKRFLRGSTTSGATGGSNTHLHTIDINTNNGASSSDTVDANLDGNTTSVASMCHYHSMPSSGLSGIADTYPPYYEVVWIMRIH